MKLILLVFLLKIVQIDCYADVKALATSLKTLTFKSRLSTTLIDRLYPVRILDCVKACVVRPRCKSINYRYRFQMCELNSGDFTTNPGDMVYNQIGVIYGEVFKWSPNVLTGDPCSSVTCPTLSKCDPTSTAVPPCVVSDCGDPSLPNGVTSSGDGTAIGRSQKLSCGTEYKLQGSDRIICQPGGTWTTVTSTCITDCGTPPGLPNAQPPSYTTTNHLSTASYTCSPGYTMTGANTAGTLTCQISTWEAFTFSCDIQDCGAPPGITNAASSYTTTTYMSTATYTCNSGYTLSGGTGQITCQAGGTWDTITFSCIWQDCGSPPGIANTATTSYTTTTYMSTATYTCNSGYALSGGTGQITCQANGSWETITFSCDGQDCGQPPTLQNAYPPSYTTTTYLSTVLYTCLTGYSLIGGSGQITCGVGGAWDNIVFTCNIQDCGTPPGIANAPGPSYPSTTYMSTATYTCDAGYAISGGTGQIRCQAGPIWETITFSCGGQSCGQPPTLPNANPPSYTATSYLSTATYTCNIGYSLSGGSGQITCGTGGTWDPISFTCNIQDCGTPQGIANAPAPSYQSTTYMSIATYTCDAGYAISGGTGQIRCQTGPIWETITFSCGGQNCGLPPTLPNANPPSYTATSYLSTATYTCQTGFSLSGGSGQITCGTGGTWDPISFTCNIQDCGQPQTLTNAAPPSYTTTTYLSTATYTCNTGYSLSGGSGQITCGSGGAWGNVMFTCNIQDCGTPQVITNAVAPSYPSTTYMSTATYTCKSGYTLSGGTGQITCQAGGTWDTITFSCVGQDCGLPNTLVNADPPSYTTTTYLSIATYICLTGYSMVGGDGQITCGTGGVWGTIWFTCNIQDCGQPQTLANANAPSYTTSTYLSTATYTCHTGYSLSEGTGQITCGAGGAWGSIGFSCNKQDCGVPPMISNAEVAYTETTYLHMATYTCNVGYTLQGSNQITCRDGPAWDPDPATISCAAQSCGTPATIQNAQGPVYSDDTFGSTATYTCIAGFTVTGTGNGVITCLAGPSWEQITFTCEIDYCATPPQLANANVLLLPPSGDMTMVQYNCYTNYVLNPPGSTSQISCDAQGWDTITFTCVLADCGSPPSLANGQWSYTTTTYLSTVVYTCNSGYILVGVGSASIGQITCQTGPAWSSMLFSCSIQVCGTPPNIANAAAPSYTSTSYMGTATYTCDSGYAMSGGTGQIMCQADGTWEIIAFSCSGQNCGTPPGITNAAAPSYTTTTYMSTTTYTCNSGYTLSGGTGQITCQAGGIWDTITFSCIGQNCGTPPGITNAAAPSYTSTTYMSMATYTCNSGYTLSGGTGQITCQAGGTWDTITFSCIGQNCGTPQVIANAAAPSYPSTTYMSTATYTCNAGYTLSAGTGQITCQASGTWDTITFSCIGQNCGTPQSITNAATSYTSTTYMSTATYTCNSGYTLSGGTGQVTCQAGGTWETITFSCVVQDCGVPPTVTNANSPLYTTTTYQSTAIYTCNTGYAINGGTAVITCVNSDGAIAWETPPFTCNLLDCGVPPTVTNANAPVYTTTTYQSTATYTCKTGYTVSGGTSAITCVNSGGTIAWETPSFTCNLPNICPSNSVVEPSSGTCYWMPYSYTTMAVNCYTTCQSQNGNVAEVTNSIQENFLHVMYSGITSGYWIGVNDIASEYVWVTSKPGTPTQTYFHWDSGEPNGYPVGSYNQDCVAVMDSEVWGDKDCDYSGHSYNCICSYDWSANCMSVGVTEPHSNTCYWMPYSARVTALACHNTCQSQNGNVAEVTDVTQDNFIKTIFLPKVSSFWIGVNDIDSESVWVTWKTGNPTQTYFNWLSGQPNDYNGQDCVTLESHGQWEDRDCDNNNYCICSYRTDDSGTQP